MAIRAVIFDIGGVLIQEMDLNLGGEWDAQLGLQPGELTQRFIDSGVPQLALIGEISRQEAWQRIAAYLHFSGEQLHEYESKLWAQCFLYTDMAQFIKDLRPRYKTATLSNDWLGAREENNRRFGLADAIQVDLMVYSAEEKLAKPDSRIYQLTCDRLACFLKKPSSLIITQDVSRRHSNMACLQFSLKTLVKPLLIFKKLSLFSRAS